LLLTNTDLTRWRQANIAKIRTAILDAVQLTEHVTVTLGAVLWYEVIDRDGHSTVVIPSWAALLLPGRASY